MAYKKFGIFSAVDTDLDTLPWANVFAKSVSDYDEAYFVTGIRPFDSGLMIMTGYFKGYIHSGSKLHDHLLEALKIWVTLDYGSVNTLLVQVSRKGKLTLVQDDESKTHMWHSSDNMFSQFAGKILELEDMEENPFLAGMGLRNACTHAAETEQSDGVPKTLPKGSRKPRNPV
jgi:hypothetical protein